MKLHDLHPARKSRRPGRRLGRGHGSGRGKTAGRGTKGQKARDSIQPWFEGGQTPLHMRTPKLHGFRNPFRVEYAAVNLGELATAEKGSLVTPDTLRHDGVIRDRRSKPIPVKILAEGDAPRGITLHAHAFSRSALAKLEAAGSTAQRISWPDGAPIPMTEPKSAEPKPSRRRRAEKGESAAEAKAEEPNEQGEKPAAAVEAETESGR